MCAAKPLTSSTSPLLTSRSKLDPLLRVDQWRTPLRRERSLKSGKRQPGPRNWPQRRSEQLSLNSITLSSNWPSRGLATVKVLNYIPCFLFFIIKSHLKLKKEAKVQLSTTPNQKSAVSVRRLTKRFNVAMHLFSNRSHMLSNCGKNRKSGTQGVAMGSSVICYWVAPPQHRILIS